MKMRRLWIAAALVIALVGIGIFLRLSRHLPNSQISDAPPAPAAQKIALERYGLMQRIEEKTYFDLSSMVGSYSHTVAFPVGKGDRIYFLYDDTVACYQHKDGTDLLVYRINLVSTDRLASKQHPVKTLSRFNNLLDYLTQEQTYSVGNVEHVQGDALPRHVTQSAIHDLSAPCEYVQYSYETVEGELSITQLSDPQDITLGLYDLQQDPVTKRMLSPGGFYRKYGLPVAGLDGLGKTLPDMWDKDLSTPPSENLPSRGARSIKLAQERYQFLVRHNSTKDSIPLSWSFPNAISALFPIGRSDRMYLCYWESWHKSSRTEIECYQRTGGKDRLIYQLALYESKQPTHEISPLNSLDDYIRAASSQAGSYTIHGKITPSVQQDLARQGDYVEYNFFNLRNALEVWRLSDMESSDSPAGEPEHRETYYLDTDPFTHQPLTSTQFFAKYGLPPAPGE